MNISVSPFLIEMCQKWKVCFWFIEYIIDDKQGSDAKANDDKFHVLQCQAQNTYEIWPSSELHLTP